MKRIIPVLAALILLVLAPASAIASSIGKESLRGLKGIFVLVEDLDEKVEREGFVRRSQLQTDAELRLRKAGIHVATKEELTVNANMGTLYINLNATPGSRSGLYAFTINVELQQDVQLVRDHSIMLLAPTYHVPSSYGTVGADHLSEIRNSLGDDVDVFINDYLSMNPK